MAAKSKHDGADCDDAGACSAEGIETRADALSLGDIGTGVFVAGAVLGVGGVVMWIAAPSSHGQGDALALTIGPTPGGAYANLGMRF